MKLFPAIRIVAVTAALLASTAAVAQGQSFATLDRMDGVQRIGMDLGMTKFEPDGIDLALRLDFHGQFVLSSGTGLHFALPISYLSPSTGSSETAMGNLQAGAHFLTGSSTTLLRGSILLPTADDDSQGVAANVLTSYQRFTDLVTAAPRATWLRLSASPLLRTGNVFFRADFGLDLTLLEDDGIDYDGFFRANVGIGVDLGTVALTGELVNVYSLEDALDDHLQNTFAIGLRSLGGLNPHIALVLPLDDAVSAFIDFSLLMGIQSGF